MEFLPSPKARTCIKAVTRGISVTVTPRYMPEESSPEQGRYFFAYTVEIINGSLDRVQLRSRYWKITDERGHVQEVRGAGVVGEQPVLGPGESFSYTSGCPLPTPSGTMQGTYADGDRRRRNLRRRDSRLLPRHSPARNACCTEVFMSLNGQRFTPLEMLAKLVSFDTESSKSNLPLIDVRRELSAELERALSCACRTRPATRRRSMPRSARRIAAAIVLSGHTDVVPVDGPGLDVGSLHAARGERARLWTRRGGHEGVRCASRSRWFRSSWRPISKTPIHIMLSYDEETTCLGVVDTIRRLGHDLPLPKAAIVGEPTMLEVVDAHKSVVTFTTTCTGSRRIRRNPISARAP